MRKLEEAFRDQGSRVDRVVLFVDMTDSTDMKLNNPEANWLTTYGWFFDTIGDVISNHEGTIVKYLGDGVMAVFPAESAADAINAAIKIQEAVGQANAEKTVKCNCSCGLSFGQVVEFQAPNESVDYIGTVADRAARICAAASAKAVFVDTDTIAAASMPRIGSTLGRASTPKRTIKQYVGDDQLLTAKGFSSPIEYNEILWDSQRYGLKSEVGSAAAKVVAQAVTLAGDRDRSGASPSVQRSREEALVGTIKMYDDDRSLGFIAGPDEDFYFNGGLIGSTGVPRAGDEAVFVPRDAAVEGKSRMATCVLVVGDEAEGSVVALPPDRDFGFVQVRDDRGNTQDVFMFVGENPDGHAVGRQVRFVVEKGRKGAKAEEVRVAEGGGAAEEQDTGA